MSRDQGLTLGDQPGWGLRDEEQQENAQGGEDAADTCQHTPADCLQQGLVTHDSDMRDSHGYTQILMECHVIIQLTQHIIIILKSETQSDMDSFTLPRMKVMTMPTM